MVAKLKILGIADSLAHPDGGALAKVGDTVTVSVSVSDRSKSKGGTFRITHGGVAGATFSFDGRIGTGDAKKLFQKKAKQAPTNYTGQDVFTFSVPITGGAALADVVLVAVTNCQVVSPDAPVQMATVATDQELADLLPTFLSVAPPIRMGVSRGGNQGIAAQAANALQSRVQFHAVLFFLDPEGNERPLPDGTPIVGVVGRQRRQFCATTVSSRAVAFAALATDMVLTHQVITLRIGDTQNDALLCELPGAPAKTQTWGPLPPPSDPTGTLPNRYLSLPRMAELVQMECEVTNDDGRYDAATGLFSLAKAGKPTSLGAQSSPVKIVLKPKWQFLRFEYFDRYFGVSDHGGNNVVMPAVTLEGHDTIPGLPAPPAHTRSNWWLDPASDGKIVQCLPWFVQKAQNGTARAKPDIQTEIVFKLPAKTCMKSVSATARSRVVATTQELEPGHDRLKFYDLPVLWKARNYYGAISTTAGEFGWYQDIATKPTAVDRPIVFCLDDIVLTDDAGKMLDSWTHDERLAIFANTFDDTTADCTKEGLYKADTAGNTPWLSQKPADGSPESSWNYLRAIPKWTRLVSAAGNLFDVFDMRSVAGSALGGDETVGARAAVRWIDATGPLPPMKVHEKSPTPPHNYSLVPNGRPHAGRLIYPYGTRPARVDKPNFAIQPFFDQEYVTRQGVYKPAEEGGSTGRCDLALLRCCGVDRTTSGSEKEVALQLYFLKQHLNFVDAPVAGEAAFKVTAHRALLDAWNGITPAHGRPTLIPTDTSKRLKVTVLTLHAFWDGIDGAHFTLTVKTGLEARNNRGGTAGTGLLADGKHVDRGGTYGFTNAHEHGHERALPDEYNESSSCASYWQLSFGQHLPGDPYYLSGATLAKGKAKPMMTGNGPIEARYFWQSAEWAHRALGFSFKLSYHGFDDYRVPTHTNPKRNHVFWPIVGDNNTTLAAIAPIAANRAKFHHFLYPLGKDQYGLKDLPALEDPVGATPYDGILILPVLLKVSPPVGDRSSIESVAKALANAPRRFGNRKLNHRWYLTGSAAATGGETWTFARCLIHFSPRLLVTAEDIPDRAAFLALENGVFKDEAVAGTFADKLDTYHAVPWTPVPAKQNAITAVRVAVAEPTLDVRADWDTASAQIVAPPPTTPPPTTPPPTPPPTRPAKFAEIDTALGQYESLGANAYDDRIAKLVVIIQAARVVKNGDSTSPYRAAAVAMDDRAFCKYKCVVALKHIAALQARAATLEADRTEHQKKVQELETLHGVHFEVVCELGAAKPARWKIGTTIVEPEKPDAYLQSLADEIRSDARIQTAVTNLRTYHDAKPEDYVARLNALDTLKTPATASPVAPRGDWNAASQITGKQRPSGFASVDSKLSSYESLGVEAHQERVDALQQMTGDLEGVIQAPSQQAFKGAAEGLKARIAPARREALAMAALRKLETLATERKDALQLEAASRHVTLTAPNADGFEAALLEVLPSMFGVYKPASALIADDLKPIVDALGITSPAIAAI